MTSKPQDLLQKYLAESEACCPSCGYALRACQSQQCPECGTHLELGLRTRPTSFGWLTAVLGALTAQLMAILLLTSAMPSAERIVNQGRARQMVAQGFASEEVLIKWSAFVAAALLCAVGALVLGGLFFVRRRFASWPAPARLALGLAGALCPLGMVGIMFIMSRGWW